MFLKDTGTDITEDEFNNIILPFDNLCHDYLQQEIIPTYAAFYIAEGFKTNSLFDNSYDVYLNEALDLFNDFPKNLEIIKSNTTKFLKQKYGYEVISENPMQLEEVVKSDT